MTANKCFPSFPAQGGTWKFILDLLISRQDVLHALDIDSKKLLFYLSLVVCWHGQKLLL